METPKLHGRVIVGIILILLGGLFVLQNYNVLDIPYDYLTWEYFFILIGLLFLFLSCNKTVGMVFISIGLFNLFPELWPLILILIGLFIIFGRKGKFKLHNKFSPESEKVNSNDYLESVSIFGGGSKVVNSDNFRGGNIVSIFGGSDINLTNSKLAEGENVIEVTAVFGGTTLIVPADWKIDVDVFPIFGGFGDKRRKDPNKTMIEGRSLVIKGVVLFGGGEVKTIF